MFDSMSYVHSFSQQTVYILFFSGTWGDLQQPYQKCQNTFPMFHNSPSQPLMRGLSCSPAKHFYVPLGWQWESRVFSYQSWEHEDRPVFPGMQPTRKEMEGTQDVQGYTVPTVSALQSGQRTRLLWPELVEELFTGIFSTSPLPFTIMEWDSLPRFSITPVLPLFFFPCRHLSVTWPV